MLHILRLPRGRVLPLVTVTLLAIGLVVPARAAEDAKTPAPAGAAATSTKAEGRAEQAPAARGAQTAAPEEVKRVVYLPESVKAALREELKQEVLAEARRESSTAPDGVPEWLRRLKLKGDIRARFERAMFGSGNANDGSFPDFNAINTNKPFDVNFIDVANERYLNVDQNRTRPRLRARLGLDADVGQGFAAGLRFASGDGSTPVSTNQTLGGSPGDFSKYQFWLDRAFLRYQPFQQSQSYKDALAIEIGRFENPFFTTDLLWDDDVNLDGIAVQVRFPAGGAVRPFLTAGAFPVFTTAFNFPPERTDKFKSLNKWLYAAQLGADFKPAEALSVKLGGALYYFDKLEGRISTPCRTDLKDQSCDTDESRPAFAQKGNTYMPLRTPNDQALVQEASGAAEYQFFGLASRFRELAATGRVELRVAPPLKATLEGEFVRNVGFSKKQVGKVGVALNNFDACDASETCQRYAGGDDGYVGRFTLGSPTQSQRWDWNVNLAYRHVESDAVVDAFDDSDFGLGGTNLKGFTFGGALALADGVWASARWMSADAIVGPTYKVDVLQIDVAARF